MKLFYVSGVRHHAIVLAQDKAEARRLAQEAAQSDTPIPAVLRGHVDDWEFEAVEELKLPNGYIVIQQ